MQEMMVKVRMNVFFMGLFFCWFKGLSKIVLKILLLSERLLPLSEIVMAVCDKNKMNCIL